MIACPVGHVFLVERHRLDPQRLAELAHSRGPPEPPLIGDLPAQSAAPRSLLRGRPGESASKGSLQPGSPPANPIQ